MTKHYFNSYREVGELCRGAIIGIGKFDGLHRGHQKLLSKVRALGKLKKVSTAVYTFNPHPARVLTPHQAVPMISSQECKKALLKGLGIDFVISENFTSDYAKMSPEQFVTDILHRGLQVSCVVVGEDYAFGRKAKGTIEVLRKLLTQCGIDLVVVPALQIEDALCSSSRIRALVEKGQVREAGVLLGRPFSVFGVVERGAGRGRRIGVPTVNLPASLELMPANGVYASLVLINGELFSGATNVGIRPTFDDGPARTIETHLIGVDRDFYGQHIRVYFLKKIRAEQKFESVEQLKDQINLDIAQASQMASAAKNYVKIWCDAHTL